MSAPQSTSDTVGLIRVLLLEDNPEDAELLRELLTDAPVTFSIQHVETLAQGLDSLSAGGVDVVLADLSLPDCSGTDTFHRLFEHAARVPIIVLSGLSDDFTALGTVKEGAQDYLVKGEFDQPLLVRSIQYAIKRAEAERALAAERNLLRSVIDNLLDAVYVKDRQGRYVLGNAAHAHQLGLASPREVIGKTTGDLFSEQLTRQFLADDEKVMKRGESIVNRHERIAEPGRPARWISTTKVPLRDATGEIVGVVGIGRDITARKQAEEQLALYTRELQEKNAEMEDDLEMAREVQQAFLPQQFPAFPQDILPEHSALQFHSRYLPTTALGGDFFHVQALSETKAGVLICDVMGHGVRAALVTAIQRALVEELTEFAEKPGEFLTQMNESLVSILRRTRSPMFASAFYVVVDTETGKMSYANAGHPRPLQVRRSAGSVILLDGPGNRPGPALGVFEHSRYLQQDGLLQPRDLLLLFTDGLYEVENARGEFYDQGMLLKAVEQRLHRPTEQIFEQTIAEVQEFSVTRSFADDVCLVGVELLRLVDVQDSSASSAKP